MGRLVTRMTQAGLAVVRKMTLEVATSVVAISLVTIVLPGLKRPGPAPASPTLAMPATIDPASGKIVDRIWGSEPPVGPPKPAASSLALFAPGLDLAPGLKLILAGADRSGSPHAAAVLPVPATAVFAASQGAKERADARRPATAAKKTPVAEAAPLPPARPDDLAPAGDRLQAAAPTPDGGGLFGLRLPSSLLPTDILPSGRKVMGQVASLGGAMLDRLTP